MAGHSVSHYSEQIAALGQSIEWLKERLPQIADLVIILTLLAYLVKEFAVPWVRRSRLRHPVDLRYNITSQDRYKLLYIVQNKDEHNTNLLVLPSFTYNLLFHVVWINKLDFTQSELLFSFEDQKDDNRDRKPLIHSWFHPFVKVGDATRKPGAYPGHYIDYHDCYHIREVVNRPKGQAITNAFIISTRNSGRYYFKIAIMAEGVEGEAWLPVLVEDVPATVMKCTVHKGCLIKPRPVIKY